MEAKLCYIGHGLMENRSGLLDSQCAVDLRLRPRRADGRARYGAQVADRPCAITLGADRGYDAADFVEEPRGMNVRPHRAQNTSSRRSAIDRRTTCHPGYAASQRIHKRVEEAFGWIKTLAGLHKTKFRDLPKVDWVFTFTAAACNLVRAARLIEASP